MTPLWTARLAGFLTLLSVAAPAAGAGPVSGPEDGRNRLDFAPELRWGRSWGSLTWTGLLNRNDGAWRIDPEISALVWRSFPHGLRGYLAMDAGSKRWPGTGFTGRLQTIGTLSVQPGPWTIWGGAGTAWLKGADGWSTTDIIRGGTSVRLGPVRVSLVSQFNGYPGVFSFTDSTAGREATMPPVDVTGPRYRPARHSYTDAGLDARWQGQKVGLGVDLNVRVGQRMKEPRASARLDGSLRLSPRVSLAARGGRLPSTPDQGIPPHHFASMALQFDFQNEEGPRPFLGIITDPPEPAFTTTALGRGRHRIRVRLADAESVELTGDFSDWQPVPLRRTETDGWEVVHHLSPGPHRVNIRVDGGPWMVPPGLQSMDDEFNGRVGIFAVR